MACGSCKKGKKREANFQLIKQFISMKLLKVKDKKGNVRRVTPNAFNLLKGRYTLLEDEEDEKIEAESKAYYEQQAKQAKLDVLTPVQDDCVSYGELKEVDCLATESASVAPPEQMLGELYSQLTGQKPDGRWSEKKLKEKIEEAKTKVNEV